MIQIRLTQQAQLILAGLRAFPEKMAAALVAEMDRQNEFTVGHIQKNRMTRRGPETLGVVTNRLRSSVRPTKAVLQGGEIQSAIGSNVVYMGIHEFGGQTKPHKIFPKKGRALAFMRGGKSVVVKSVNHPGSKIPARAPIRRGIEDRAENYSRALSAAILRAVPTA